MDEKHVDFTKIASEVLDGNKFLTLGTAGSDGVPWVAPLMYAVDSVDQFYWVSERSAVHSVAVRENAAVAFVVFDSNPEYGSAQGLYCSARAIELSGESLTAGCDVFYRMRYPDAAEREQKGRHAEDFEGDSPRRMYRATVTSYSLLHPGKHPIYGSLVDYRVEIPFSTSFLARFAR